ncbi:MAG TPA: hypothetical protein EYH39_02230 [Desulfurobacteriaceae bacterium]|nr:hypothetical protein [Desulfurobacteriaceae bacterium]
MKIEKFLKNLSLYYEYIDNLPISLKLLSKSSSFRNLSQNILSNLQKGKSLSQTLYKKKLLSKEEIQILKFGEENGFLLKSINFVIFYRDLKEKYKSLLFQKNKYSLIVLLFSFVFLILFKEKFLAEVEKIYLNMDLELHPLLKFWKIIFSLPVYIYLLFILFLTTSFYFVFKKLKTFIKRKFLLIVKIKILLFLIDTQGFISSKFLKEIFKEERVKVSDIFKNEIEEIDLNLLKLSEEGENLKEGLKYLENIYENKFFSFLDNLSTTISISIYIFSVFLVTFLILSYQLPLLFGKLG